MLVKWIESVTSGIGVELHVAVRANTSYILTQKYWTECPFDGSVCNISWGSDERYLSTNHRSPYTSIQKSIVTTHYDVALTSSFRSEVGKMYPT